MDPFFIWLEATSLSTWIREEPSVFAFLTILTVHTIGMALVVGIGVALDFRILGVAPQVPIVEMKRFFPAMWVGLWLNVVSGAALLIGYPTKALTNPVFFLKLAFIALALVILQAMRRRVVRDGVPAEGPMPTRLRMLAVASILSWAGAIASGRLLAYTYTRLMAIP